MDERLEEKYDCIKWVKEFDDKYLLPPIIQDVEEALQKIREARK